VICLSCGAQLDAEAEVCSECSVPTGKNSEVSEVEGLGVNSMLRPGQRLADRYLVKRSLGVGRIGVTYHVTDLDTGRDVALKTIFRHLLFSKRDRARFQAWMEAARPLSSSRVAAPQRSGRDERFGSFVIAELIDAPSLASLQRVRNRPANVAEVAALVTQLRVALDGLESAPPHGGLHPGNVLVLPDRVVLTDLSTYQGMLPQLWAEAQRQGPGGVSWLAPEVVQGREDLDRRADVYSVTGLVMWLLTGLEPGRKALEAVRERWPAVAGVLSAAHTDLASERLYEVMPVEAALLEAARGIETSGEVIALNADDLLDSEIPEEVTEITSSEEFSIREEDVLGVQTLSEEPTPIRSGTPSDHDATAPLDPPKFKDSIESEPTPIQAPLSQTPAAAPAVVAQPKTAEYVEPGPLRERPAPRNVKAVTRPAPSEEPRRLLPQWFVLAACASIACAVTYVAAKTYLKGQARGSGSVVVSDQALRLDDPAVAAVVVDAGGVDKVAEEPVKVGNADELAVDQASAERSLAAIAAVSKDSGPAAEQDAPDAGTALNLADLESSQDEKTATANQALAPAPEPSETDSALVEPDAEPVVVAARDPEPVAEPEPEPAVVEPRPEPVPVKPPVGRAKCGKGMGLVRARGVAVCVDRYEYPNYLRSPPQGNFNAYKAQALCEKKGKRICTEREWVAACSGSSGQRFPYGSRFVAGRCNTIEDGRDEAVAPIEYKKCRSPARIYAMAGNLAEWTKSSSGFALKGGSYAHGGSSSRCGGQLRSSPRVAQLEFGVRCCADPTYE